MNLPRRLFWDSNPETLDYEQHARHIIERVVTRGSLEDWAEIKRHYGLERIKKEVIRIRSMDDKTLTFLSKMLEIPKENFRCFANRSSDLKHLPF